MENAKSKEGRPGYKARQNAKSKPIDLWGFQGLAWAIHSYGLLLTWTKGCGTPQQGRGAMPAQEEVSNADRPGIDLRKVLFSYMILLDERYVHCSWLLAFPN